jgi:two-component system, LuxR family, sensor kinase FixL
LNDVLAILATARSTQLTPQIEDRITRFRQAELSLLKAEQQNANHAAVLATFFAGATGILPLLLDLSVGEAFLEGKRQFVGFVRDLTQRQERERVLHELQSKLMRISRLSTMGEMASSLAHELNQPLAAMTNYLRGSKRLLESSADERVGLASDALDKAADQALRAGQVIQRLRAFGAHGETERRIESIKKLVEEASALALLAAKEQSVQVTMEFDPSVDLILADRIQV